MPPISFKDCPLILNSNNIIANSASLSISNPKKVIFSLGSKNVSGKTKEGAIRGSVNFTFLLSHGYFLKDLINKAEKTHTSISGNLGGITFSNGRLESLSFSIEPDSIIWGQATIGFWGVPASSMIESNVGFNLSGVGSGNGSEVVCILDTGGTNEEISGISSYEYNLTINYRDTFVIGSITPDTKITEIQEVVNITAENIGTIMSECGKIATINSTIKDGCGTTFDNFDVTGDLTSQEISTELGNFVSGNLSIIKDY